MAVILVLAAGITAIFLDLRWPGNGVGGYLINIGASLVLVSYSTFW